MAANKFATMLHRSTNRVAVVLVYTLLEWILIALLLLNALFAYLISRFVSYFGLKPPCLICSRVDHLLGPRRPLKPYPDLLCEDHVAEISRLGYCANHRRFAGKGGKGVCLDCRWEGAEAVGDAVAEGEDWRCSCCGAGVEDGFASLLDLVIKKPTLGDLGRAQIADSIEEERHARREGDRRSDNGVVTDEFRLEEGEKKDEVLGEEAAVRRDREEETREVAVEGETDQEFPDGESIAPSQSSEVYYRVYGDNACIKVLNQCRECGTIMEERIVSLIDLNSPGSDASLTSEGNDDVVAHRRDIALGSFLDLAAAVDLGEALDSTWAFSPALELANNSVVYSSLVSTGGDANEGSAKQQIVNAEGDRPISGTIIDPTKEQVANAGGAQPISGTTEDSTTEQVANAEGDQSISGTIEDSTKEQAASAEGDGSVSEFSTVEAERVLLREEESEKIPDATVDAVEDDKTDCKTNSVISIINEGFYLQQTHHPELQEHIDPLNGIDMSMEVCNEAEEKAQEDGDKTDGEVSIGSEICEKEHACHLQLEEPILPLVGQVLSTEVCHGTEERVQGSKENDNAEGAGSCEVSFRGEISDEVPIGQTQLLEPISSSAVIQSIDLYNGAGEEEKVSEENTRADGASNLENSVRSEIWNVEKSCHPLLEPLLPSAQHVLSMDLSCCTEVQNKAHGEYRNADGEGNCKTRIGSDTSIKEQSNYSTVQESDYQHIEQFRSTDAYSGSENGSPVNNIEFMETPDQSVNNDVSACPEVNEVEEERTPETPTSMEGFHNLQRRFMFDRREYGTESIDGSVVSETDASELLTTEQLKAALKVERKSLSALYAELEEERSASAIAANQTMAMITRLQEEKAAMQMEALQYQRMMEEQSEYDQEALQILNELVMKREKEKKELKKELEVYKKRVLHYEANERRMKSVDSNGNCRSLTVSSDGDEESDGLSLELDEEEENLYGIDKNQNTPDSVLGSVADQESAKHLSALDESLDDFEEERLSILDQLKILEGKLFSLDGGEDLLKDNEHVDQYLDKSVCGVHENGESQYSEVNDFSCGSSDDLFTDRKRSCRKQRFSGGKRLLPLFDVVSGENRDPPLEGHVSIGVSPRTVSKCDSEQQKIAIAEEVDTLYERLQCLEADREFLKHCIRSLKNGDRGINLLQDILQYLHDLRNVELGVRNGSNASASPSA